ncbi:MAG: ubiquinone/menaquinone biosynthesis methyltransferase [Anaerolineae bacterium]
MTLDPHAMQRAAIARTFAAIARRYALMNRLRTFCREVGGRRCASRLLGPVAGGGPILDIGAGTADLSLMLARARPGARIVGLDLTAEMLNLGHDKVERAGLSGRISLLQGDALALPFTDSSFAAVASAFAIRNLPDVPAALAEMRRVVVPGGTVLCLELSQPRVPGFRSLFRPYFACLVPLLGTIVAGQRAAYTYLPASVDRFLSPLALQQAMAAAGLEDVRVKRLALGAACIHVARRPTGHPGRHP